jgi:hypothetical protein
VSRALVANKRMAQGHWAGKALRGRCLRRELQ